MRHIFCLLAILTIVAGCRREGGERICPWRRRHHRHRFQYDPELESESLIEDTKKKFIEAEIKLQELCNTNNQRNIPVLEEYDIGAYTLIYVLEETENLNITVRIFHKLIQTEVKKYVSNELIIEDLKILPSIVKTEEASWKLDDGRLLIRIPYKIPLLKEVPTVCEAINTGVINVPPAPVAYTLDVRFGANQNDSTDNQIINK